MDQSTTVTKTCTTCKIALPLDAFYARATGRYGVCATCKVCNQAQCRARYEAAPHRHDAKKRAWNEENRERNNLAKCIRRLANLEEQRARDALYRLTHREQIAAANAAWLKKNGPRNAAYRRAWREANPEREQATAKAWKAANAERRRPLGIAYRQKRREEIREMVAAWRRSHPDATAAYRATQRARQAGAPTIERIDRAGIIARDNSTCYLCGRFLLSGQVTLDHVVPLAAGGEHTSVNLRVACRSCNSRKHVLSLAEFLAKGV